MHTGTISFADRIAYNIKSSNTKDDILQELASRFQVKILQKHWNLLDAKSVQHLYRSPHLACLRSNGNPYYLYFTRYEDVPIMYYIDKKVQPGYDKPRIILGRGFFDACVFDNTLMEGEMVKDKNGCWIFLINDLIGQHGRLLDKMPLPARLDIAHALFQCHYREDPLVDVCTFHVKQYAHATQEGVTALLELATQLPYTNRGLYFWPFYLSYKPKLLNFDPSLIKEVVRKAKDTVEFRVKAESSSTDSDADAAGVDADEVNGVNGVNEVNAADADGGCEAEAAPTDATAMVMLLKKTDCPDVYNVFGKDNKKQGIAYVPTLACSRMLRDVFKDRTVAVSVAFECKYVESSKKWQPLRLAA